MNVYLEELRSHRKSLMIWILSLLFSLLLMLFMYPAVMSEKDAYEKILQSLPPELLEAFSVNFDTLLSFNGFLGYIYGYLLIALGILSMNLGLSAIGKEVSGKTADFLMTKPLSRKRLLGEKSLAGLTMILITNAVIAATLWGMNLVLNAGEKKLSVMFLIILAGLMIQLLFFTLGLFLGVTMRRIRMITSMSLSYVFSFFILSMVAQVVKKDFLDYFTPFRYFDFNDIILQEAFQGKFLLLALLLILMLAASSFLILEKKEIHA